MALIKTYLLAPNFTFRPDGPIALGNIIADPSKPHRFLTKHDPDKPTPEIESAVEYDYTVRQGAGHGISMGLWAQFLQVVGGNIGTEHGKSTNIEYNMSTLKTVYFKNDPSEEELRERVSVPRVRNIMRYGGVWSKPVYMVTGVKIAEGFTASTEAASSRSGSVGASVPVVPEVSVGAEFGLSQEMSQKNSFRSGNDIIFAYQLLKIAPKGWRHARLEASDYQSKAAFLGAEPSEDEESDMEIESNTVTAEDFTENDVGKSCINTFKVDYGEESCVCISLSGI